MTKSLISVDAAQIAQWVEQFNRDGFLFIQNVIPPDLCAELRADLDRMLMDDSGSSVGKSPQMEIVLRYAAEEQDDSNLSAQEQLDGLRMIADRKLEKLHALRAELALIKEREARQEHDGTGMRN